MDFITRPKQIETELLGIDSFLSTELETSPDDLQTHADEVYEKGKVTNTYMARSGKLLADAKYHLNEVLKSDILISLISQMEGTHLSASAQKEFIRSAATYNTYLVDLADRVNRTCVHQIEWYRSVLVKLREEIKSQRGF